MAAFKRRRSKPLRFITAPLPVDHPSWLDLDRQLPPDHLARRIRFLVEQLDLDSLLETYSGVGGALYPPDLLLAFVLFETQRGRLSPAQWFTDSSESIPGRWLLRGLLPTRSTFYRFRKHLPAELVDELNRSVLLLAQAEGHTTADNGSLDGTFTAAYGSRHRLLNRITLARRLHLLDDAIATANAGDARIGVASCPAEPSQAATAATASPTTASTRLPSAADGPLPSPEQAAGSSQTPAPAEGPLGGVASCPAEPSQAATAATASSTAAPTCLPDAPVGPLAVAQRAAGSSQTPAPAEGPLRTADRPYWMVRTATGRLRQRERYQRAQRILQERLSDHEQRQHGKSARRRKNPDKVVICPSDPEAVMGKDKHKVFRPLFNTQILQDVDSAFVLGYQVYAQVTDSGLLPPMLERTRQLTGRKMTKVRGDGIYASLKDVRYCKENSVALYAPVERASVPVKGAGGPQEQGKDRAAGGKGSKGKRKERRFGKEQFPWDEARQSYHCPQGHLLQLGRIRKKDREPGEYVEVQEYRFAKEHCQKCPQAQQCTSQPEKGRTVERMVGQELLDEVAARMRTTEGKAEYRKRKQTVEPRHGDMRRHRGLQEFRGYGQPGAESQVGLLVLAHNGLSLLKARKKGKATQAAGPGTPAPTRQPQATQAAGPGTPAPTRQPQDTQAAGPRTPAPTRQQPPAIPSLQDDKEWLSWN